MIALPLLAMAVLSVQVSGQVIDEKRRPVPQADVHAWAIPEHLDALNGNVGGGMVQARADASGAFVLRDLAPGRYTLIAIASVPDRGKRPFLKGAAKVSAARDVSGARITVHPARSSDFALNIQGDLQPEPASDFHIAGTVVDPQGKPIAHAEILALCKEPVPQNPDVKCSGGSWIALPTGKRATSGANGSFAVEDLPAAVFTAMAFAELGGHKYATAEPQTVSLTESRDGVRLVLAPLQAITGVLRDQRGRPLEGFRIHAAPVKPPPLWDGERTTPTTKSDGSFSIPDLPAAEYEVSVERSRARDAKPVRATPGGAPVSLQISPVPWIRGRVLGAHGLALQDVRVSPHGQVAYDGSFTALAPAGGKVQLQLEAPGYKPLAREVELRGESADVGTLTLQPERPLLVSVSGAGKPLDAAIFIQGASSERAEKLAEGRYFIARTGTGPLKLRVTRTGFVPADAVVDPALETFSVALDEGGKVSARLHDADGKPLAGRIAISYIDSSCFTEGTPSEAAADANGVATLTALKPGTCVIEARAAPFKQGDLLANRWVDVGRGGPAELEFRAPSTRSAIRVRGLAAAQAVLWAGHVPASAPASQLFPSAQRLQAAANGASLGFQLSKPENGGLSFADIAPGPYTLVYPDGTGVRRMPLDVAPGQTVIDLPKP